MISEVPSPAASTAAIVLAGGKGERLGGDTPKQFLQLVDRPMLCHSLDAFEACEAVDSVVLVVPGASFTLPPGMYSKLYVEVTGGATRQESVANGLATLPPTVGVVMVHDAARPLLDVDLIERLLAALDGSCDGVIPGIPLEDSIKRVSGDGRLQSEVDRTGVWRVQTPQVFGREQLEDALARAVSEDEDSPDCSQMLTRAGYRVKVVEGDPINLKVTRRLDLKLAEVYLRARWGGQL